MITAPYNFVPLNKKIFYPAWADEKTLKTIHDVPFEDGESGTIELEITARSQIFIKNSEKRDAEKDEKKVYEFCHFKNKNGGKEYYIPATSIKGMIRNVVEIMSFGRIRIDEAKHKKPLSVRDMTTGMDFLVGKATGCGFLVKNGDGYAIEDCADIRTIYLSNPGYKDVKKLKTAEEKYKRFGLLKESNFTTYDEQKTNKIGKVIKIKRARFDPQGQKGILVFTGDIDNKKHEFVFIKNDNKIPLEKSVFSDFEKVYFDNQQSIDGQFWKHKFNKGEKIPVFYVKDKNSGKIVSVGLTQLFKLAYKKTIFEAAKQSGDDAKFDLAETIFGSVKADKALKGRVYFSHLKSTIERYEKEQEGVFGTPNPSYYPNYLEQEGDGKYITLMSQNAVIRGYKRYPLHESVERLNTGNGSKDMLVKFKPLPANSVFKGKVVFHNLKSVEIGALLSALTFHGQSDKYMHNIGFAKPYGYGKIQIEFKLARLEHDQKYYLDKFEAQMTEFDPNWRKSKQLNELFAMASVKFKPAAHLRYQQLENNQSSQIGNKNKMAKNEFSDAKKLREILSPYSQFGDVNSGTKYPSGQKQTVAKSKNDDGGLNRMDFGNIFGGSKRK